MQEMRDGMAKRTGRWLLSPFLGKRRFQSLFQDIYEVALAGLNYGEGANPKTSGERCAIDYVVRAIGEERPITVLDVGANIGQYATSVIEIAGDGAQIYCFEPASGTFQTLSATLGRRPNVLLENFALGDEEGEATLFSVGEGSKMASLYDRKMEYAGLRFEHQEAVRLRTVDGYCSEHGIDRVELLKMDVEGHEMSVLHGASRMLSEGRVRFLQFEFSNANIDSRTFFRDFYELLSPDYRIFRMLSDGLAPVERYSETQEVFKRATNYLAERRSWQ